MTLMGKKAIVTGGSRGIGAAIARKLAGEGADVALTYAGSREAAEAVAAEIVASGRQGHAVRADARDPAAVRAGIEQAAAALGGIDILVHNAGVAAFSNIAEGNDAASYRDQFAVNVDAVFHATSAALPHFNDGGRIMVIGSVNAHWMPFAGAATYGATKAAVAQLARGWARDLAPRGILVNVIQPGPVDTDMNPADGPLADVIRPSVALGRYGRPEEIAALAAFLASDAASYITGATIDIDGGASL